MNTLGFYDIDETTGFLPPTPPIGRLSAPEYEPWEMLVDQMRGLLLVDRFRTQANRLAEISTSHLGTDVREWRRAAVVLSMIASAYVWGRHQTPGPAATASGMAGAELFPTADAAEYDPERPVSRILPRSIAVPLAACAVRLGIRPIICYATTTLWNYGMLDPAGPMATNNLFCRNTSSGTMDEAWFYLIPLFIELEGAPGLHLMSQAWTATQANDSTSLESHLKSMVPCVKGMTKMMRAMHARCDPYVFYHQVRPYVAGWALVDGGVRYEGIEPTKIPPTWFAAHGAPGHYHELAKNGELPSDPTFFFAGGSAGQSSIVQAYDIFLGITHHPTGYGPGSKAQGGPKTNFIKEMREYMPAKHRQFLVDAETLAPSVREYVSSHSAQSPKLLAAYNAVVAAVKEFRDVHLQVVARFIVMQAKKSPSAATPPGSTATVAAAAATNGSVAPAAAATAPATNGATKRPRSELDMSVVPEMPPAKRANTGGDVVHVGNGNGTNGAAAHVDGAPPGGFILSNGKRSISPATAGLTRSMLTELNHGATDPADGGVRGTGGTQLMPFLKQARDETDLTRL
ncbi:Indoleamine 2,3-dioxygenase-domain-containing protein [Blastocladiella britannica]|nr:Indoleamine 2,3-dioxygenase-domain-containing protein [Blastocladiella britannica]